MPTRLATEITAGLRRRRAAPAPRRSRCSTSRTLGVMRASLLQLLGQDLVVAAGGVPAGEAEDRLLVAAVAVFLGRGDPDRLALHRGEQLPPGEARRDRPSGRWPRSQMRDRLGLRQHAGRPGRSSMWRQSGSSAQPRSSSGSPRCAISQSRIARSCPRRRAGSCRSGSRRARREIFCAGGGGLRAEPADRGAHDRLRMQLVVVDHAGPVVELAPPAVVQRRRLDDFGERQASPDRRRRCGRACAKKSLADGVARSAP